MYKNDYELRNLDMKLVKKYINGYIDKLALQVEIDETGNRKPVEIDQAEFANN